MGSAVVDPVPELQEGIELEQALRWSEALAVYERLEAQPLTPNGRVEVRLRKANALMELGRMDEARRGFDACIEEAKAAGDSGLLARTLVGAGVYAANAGDPGRAEPFLLRALELASPLDDPESRLTAGWAMLNLGGLYGKTGRLDLAFVTLGKARERLGAIGNWVGVGAAWETQAQLRRAIGDEDRWREDLAEAVVLYQREGLGEKARRLGSLLGRKQV